MNSSSDLRDAYAVVPRAASLTAYDLPPDLPPEESSEQRERSFGSNGYSHEPGRYHQPGQPQMPESGTPQRVPVRLTTVQPVVVYVILGLTVTVFLLQMASQYMLGGDVLANLGAKSNELIMQGQFWRLITPVLLHGGLLHIGFNMYALYILGPGLEAQFGHGRFLALYLLSGFAGNVMSFLFTASPSLGASTAIFGLLAAQGVFVYQNRQVFGGIAQRALTNIVIIAGINLVIGFSSMIDNWGHMGGLLGGLLFTWYAGPLLHVEGIYPNLRVVDTRSSGDVLRAGLSTFLLFGLLVVVTMFLRG